MCPNCFTSLAMALGGAGSVVLLGSDSGPPEHPGQLSPNIQETAS